MTYTILDPSTVEQHHGVLRPLRQALGVSAFGINKLELGANAEGFEHDHAGDGQEEVYVIVGGSGSIRVDGEESPLVPGNVVFLSPEAKRQMVSGPDGLSWVGVGCQPGGYTPRQQ